jgi:hypothetical protein
MSKTIVITLSSDSNDSHGDCSSECLSLTANGSDLIVNSSDCGDDIVFIQECQASGVTSINGKIGNVVLTKQDIGLSNVNNTSDLNKPISILTQSALNLKANVSDFNILANSVDDFYLNTNLQVKRGNEAYLFYSPYSSLYLETYTNLYTNSALFLSGANTLFFQKTTGYWQEAYTNLYTNSSLYLEGYKVYSFLTSNFLYLTGGKITGNLEVSDFFANGQFNLNLPATIPFDQPRFSGKNHIVGDYNAIKGNQNIILGNNNIVGKKAIYVEYDRFNKSFKFSNSLTSLFSPSELTIGNRFIGYAYDLNRSFEFVLAGYDTSSNLLVAEFDTIQAFSTNGFILLAASDNKILGSNVIAQNDNVIVLNATTGTSKLETTQDNQITLNADNGIYFASNVGIGTDDTSTYALNVSGEIHSNYIVSDNNGNSNQWNSNYTTYKQNSSDYVSLKFVTSKFLPNSGGLISGDLTVQNNFTVYGDISALGTSYFQNTLYTTSTSLCIIHDAPIGVALFVASRGLGDILSLYDLDTNIEVFHVGGANGEHPNVGVKTSTPNVDFTVNGSISANSIIYDASGNSQNWNYAFDWVDAGIIECGYF